MKKITVCGPVILNVDGKEFRFGKGEEYEVTNAIADNGYLAQYLLTKIELPKDKSKKDEKKAEEPKETEEPKEAKDDDASNG